jgi:flagellin
MTSLITNISAMAALSTLKTIGGRLDKTQDQVSTGLRVTSAADNASYWSIATTMKSDKSATGAAADAVGVAQGVVDTASAAMQTVLDSFTGIRNIAITARQLPAPGFQRIVNSDFSDDPVYDTSASAQLNAQAQDLLDTAKAALTSASFAGTNLIYNAKHADVASTAVNTFVVGYADGKTQTLDIPAKDTLVLNDNYGIYDQQLPGEYNPEKTMLDGSTVSGVDGSFEVLATYWFNIGVHNQQGEPEAYPLVNSYPIRGIENFVQRFGPTARRHTTRSSAAPRRSFRA